MIFGCFLMMSAVLLWRKTRVENLPDPVDAGSPKENTLRALGIFCTAGFCGVAAGEVWLRGGGGVGGFFCLLVGVWPPQRQGGRPILSVPPPRALAVRVSFLWGGPESRLT